jgi:hypothetical protein
LGFAETR